MMTREVLISRAFNNDSKLIITICDDENIIFECDVESVIVDDTVRTEVDINRNVVKLY